MMTAEEIVSLKVGDEIQLNFDVHRDHGPNPKTWGEPMRISEINHRGETADCHPRGGGHPFVSIAARRDGWPSGSSWGFCIGTDNRGVRLFKEGNN